MTVTPANVTIHPGDQNIPLNITLGDAGYNGPATVTMTGLPSGISVSPVVLNAGGSGTLTLNASRSADNEDFNNILGISSKTTTVNVIAISGSVQTTATVKLTVSLSNPSFAPDPQSINLPIVRIDTNGAPIESKTNDVPGTITITSSDGQTSYLPNSSAPDNTATFHVHGNTTAVMPKRPYNIKLNTSLDLLSAMGMNCPYVTGKGKAVCDKSKTYILLANYDDKTFIRDWAGSALANAIPIGNGYLDAAADSPTPSGTSTLMPWAAHSLFVELYVNGEYEGNYQLIEKANVDGNRINIHELDESDTSGDLSGGYFMEIDQHKDEDYVFTTPHGLPIGLQDPDYTPEVPEQTDYITQYVDAAENALFSSSFTDPTSGWRTYFDEAAAVNFYIVNDLMGNQDAGDFYSSVYLYKNKGNPMLYMGPVWDFDISAGNVSYSAITNPTVPWMQVQAPWYARLFQDPGFKADVVKQWNTLKKNGVFDTWLSSIQQQAQKLEQSQANNFGRWPMQGIQVWPNAAVAGSYDGEVAYLLNWLKLRLSYLDSLFNNKTQTATTLATPSGTLRQGTRVTLQSTTTAGPKATGTVTFLAGAVVLGSSPLDDNGHASTTVSLPAGQYTLTAAYSGDDTNALSLSNAVSVAVAAPLISTVTSLANTDVDSDSQFPTFTAMVAGNTGTAIPTGSIAFTENGQSLGVASLNGNGTATFSPTQLVAGSHSVQAVYSGDNTYQGSTSGTVVVTVTAPPPLNPDFDLATSTTSLNIKAGQTVSLDFSITPENGFHAPVSFACSELPAGATCSFSPATVTPQSSSVQTALFISMPRKISSLPYPSFPLSSGSTIAIGLCCFFWRRKLRVQLLVMVLSILSLGILNGCGESRNTQATSTVTVTATSGQLQHAFTFTLIEHP